MPTYDFDLPIDEVIEEAFELAGGDQIGAEDLRSIKRSLNLLMIDLQNREVPLSHLEKIEIPLTKGVNTYVLDEKILDILNAIVTVEGTDLPMSRMGILDYNHQPAKDTEGRPNIFVVDRQKAGITMNVWPTPESDVTMTIWAFRKNANITNYSSFLDIATKYLPAITMGLASFMALKKNPEKYVGLKSVYEEMLDTAFKEDRERTSVFFVPSSKRV